MNPFHSHSLSPAQVKEFFVQTEKEVKDFSQTLKVREVSEELLEKMMRLKILVKLTPETGSYEIDQIIQNFPVSREEITRFIL
jgi:hypothetical protein